MKKLFILILVSATFFLGCSADGSFNSGKGDPTHPKWSKGSSGGGGGGGGGSNPPSGSPNSSCSQVEAIEEYCDNQANFMQCILQSGICGNMDLYDCEDYWWYKCY